MKAPTDISSRRAFSLDPVPSIISLLGLLILI
jgi:hypothetical protein